MIIKLGVPQGSVLGPLLSIMCTYDISDCANFGTFKLFAEDTNTFANLLKMISVREVWNLAVSRLRKCIHMIMLLTQLASFNLKFSTASLVNINNAPLTLVLVLLSLLISHSLLSNKRKVESHE